MTEPMEALYTYAQKYLFPAYLDLDEHYAASDHCAGRQMELLRAALTDEGKLHLNAMLDELTVVQAARDRAVFRSGFRLALELSRG